MAASVPDSPARRDPAWVGRVFWTCAALVILAPALVAAEFKPWVMLSPENLKVTARAELLSTYTTYVRPSRSFGARTARHTRSSSLKQSM